MQTNLIPPQQQQQMMGGLGGPNQLGGGQMAVGGQHGGMGMGMGAPPMAGTVGGVRPPPGAGGGGGSATGGGLNTQQLAQIMQKIKNNPTNESNQHILTILKHVRRGG